MYVELKGKFERLQADYGQVQKANNRLPERLQEVKLENKSLRRSSADYAQLKQILGAEQIEATLNAATQQKKSGNVHAAPLDVTDDTRVDLQSIL